MTTLHTPLLIIGSGPAGYTAAVYAARASLKPVIIAGLNAGGQLTKTTDIENFPAFESIGGTELMTKMQEQAERVGTQIVYDEVVKVDLNARPLRCVLDGGDEYTCDALIVATGASVRWLNIPNEEKFKGFGVSACATCDGFFFRNKTVAVVGGGSSAVDEALYLANLASKVYLIHRRDSLRAEKVLQDRLFANEKVEILWNKTPVEFNGGRDLESVTLKDTQSGELSTLKVDGVFEAIGLTPNTDLFKGQLELDEQGYIVTHDGRPFTNIDGVFVAGDVQEKHYRQAVTAAAGGCKAAIEAERYLSANK